MLSDFIRANLQQILADWEAFAETLRPASLNLSRKELRNTAADILHAVADDMESAQTPAQQLQKSRGELRRPSDIGQTARRHAGDRLEELFTLNQMVSEYRALRASVIQRWGESLPGTSHELEQLHRFNEAIDQSLTEAIRWFDTCWISHGCVSGTTCRFPDPRWIWSGCAAR
jgi:hypothetical protein